MGTKYIFVTGGVVSGLGKGITAASLGRLLKQRGYKVTIQKFDPYINIDPGNMNPYQHGEVFVTDDGAVTDLDLGHYERFIDENLTVNNSVTAGKIYWSVLKRERNREYGGATVQVIPHITNAIKEKIYNLGMQSHADIVIVEVGGTVGDIESLPFLESIRQVAFEVERSDAVFIHVTLIPQLGEAKEMKTKPSQHSVKELLSIGIRPDVIVCRTSTEISKEVRNKLELFCNVGRGCVVQNLDADSVYEIPLLLEKENLAQIVLEKLELPCPEPDLMEWRALVEKEKALKDNIAIGLVGKYIEMPDAYLSVMESLRHSGIHSEVHVKIKWVDANELEKDISLLEDVDGVIVPGGFGERGVEGKILAAKYAREKKIPYFGLCLGMQCAVIEFARNVAGLYNANSTEFSEATPYNVIDILPEQKDEYTEENSSQMRHGAQPCKLMSGTRIMAAYGEDLIYERHRHRYEFNNAFKKQFEEAGLVIAAITPSGRLVEAVELPGDKHPWFVGVQFHPEFKSRPNRPHPLFMGFVKASIEYSKL